MSKGLILSAPASGSGKTVLTLGILRALKNHGVTVAAAKSGPDYIDPRFHDAACGGVSVNLDGWAMAPEAIRALASQAPGELLVIEGAMGLFDGAPPDGGGSTAQLAQILDLPVVLIVDAAHQGQSVAALVEGFARYRAGVRVEAVILNKIGSPRHEAIVRAGLGDMPVLGAVPREPRLALPSRHLGLVQASETAELEDFLDHAAEVAARCIDLAALAGLAAELPQSAPVPPMLDPLGQRIAVAKDQAFSFAYPHVLQGWISAGASLLPFSPLADQPPDVSADAIYLPGGYPEIYAGQLASAGIFRSTLQAAAAKAVAIYGECGGFMALGDGLIDASGQRHAMLGLLRLETSFAERRLHLGYRRLTALGGPWRGDFNGHEFHYSTTLRAEGQPLFAMRNAEGEKLESSGLIDRTVSGSFAHLIAKAPAA